MADRDEALHYLLNKLKSEDGWSGASLAWNEEKLSVIADQFSSFDGVVKAKVLLSFLSMTPRTISQCAQEMQHIIRLARRDGDEWVRLFAGVLAPLPNSQSIAVDACLEGSMEGVMAEIGEALSKQTHHSFIPHEYAYLNQTVLEGSHGYTMPTQHEHFVLRKQPQASVNLRCEMLQRAGTDFSQTGSLVKDRHLLQRQLSSTGTSSNPFVPTSRTPSSRKLVPIPGVSSRIQRERGTKLLDLNEVPVASKRKRRAVADTEIRTDSKKIQRTPSKSETPEVAPPTPSQPVTATPDYAAGLGAEYVPGPPLQTGVYPDRSEGLGEVGGVAVPRAKSMEERAADPSPFAGQPYTPPAIPQSSHPPLTPLTPVTPLPPPTPGGEPLTPVSKQPTKGLRLSRQQLQIAQEMFKESPSLTREQKTLILGFMAGSRENPHPSHPIVSIKLNEKHTTEQVVPAEGQPATVRHMLIETVFEMNYSNGQWRKLLFKKTLSE